MSEVDDNLNYMLGQLSLVVSEFNQVDFWEITSLVLHRFKFLVIQKKKYFALSM